MKTSKYLMIFFLLSLCSACDEDEFLTEEPRDDIYADQLYSDYNGFQMALNASYAMVREEFATTANTSLGAQVYMLSGTDIAWSPNTSGSDSDWLNWSTDLAPDNDAIEDIFMWLYREINSVNKIIARASNPEVDWQGSNASENEAKKNEVIAHARLLRAWAYRHLTYLYGDVPLSLDEIDGANYKTDWVRAPVAEVRAQMIEDLSFAGEYLPWKYPNPGRANKAVALHYLAETYCAAQDYEKAVAAAENVIKNSGYALVRNRFGRNASNPGNLFIDMFREPFYANGNTETLWGFLNIEQDVNPEGNFNNRIRDQYYSYYSNATPVKDYMKDNNVPTDDQLMVYEYNGGKGAQRAAITEWAYGLYEEQDMRTDAYTMAKYIVFPNMENPSQIDTLLYTHTTTFDDEFYQTEKEEGTGGASAEWPYTRKWDYVNPSDPKGVNSYNDFIYIRLAETYLIYAEAQLGNGQPEAAKETLNVLRRRSNASEYTGTVDIDFILDERARELFGEVARRHALVRTGKFLERARKHNRFMYFHLKDYHKLWPIPQSVIDSNTGSVMAQNTGY
ncbi:RagB/SusD family nutrient uptake outer membrane protein [Galbibacter pacificus]|uniref:RagB/SusD family nutrient uptake outer membrane protein n=1 Tax=Galbibacter pacificus TaxID=2996052 RepID=A0ABT6FSB0_9FLAO|nr:RagB/SusD family nutrient uptake outer membrane protein [Galbibacter pacificus]MDG3582900.1 RagB/SusD family nutrient uptake outer membrane protein [Galbibacter pacificus]MDG3585981.1 RagB/SusD family nutrient uptake outer membrane protein [Galbibacter pacificus]